jgi:hypothetical protein
VGATGLLPRPVAAPRSAMLAPPPHLAFYAGWPAANTAVTIARTALAENQTK